MSTPTDSAPTAEPVILLIDEDVMARTAISTYLRECGYRVIETNREVEGKQMLAAQKHAIDIAICAISDAKSSERFDFLKWSREHHPHVKVLLAATLEKTAKLAAEICEEGPHLRKPYEHQALLDWIKRLRS